MSSKESLQVAQSEERDRKMDEKTREDFLSPEGKKRRRKGIRRFFLIMLVLTSLFGLWGYIAGFALTLAAIAGNKTIAGKSYIYPLFPLNLNQLKKRFLRLRLKEETEGK